MLSGFFNNREIVISIIIFAGLVFAIFKKEIRTSLLAVIKSLFQWKLILPIVISLLYIYLFVWLLYKANIWDRSLLKDTIFWVGAALVMLFNFQKISTGLGKYLRENFNLIIILEFIAGLYVFSIFGEIVLVPLVIILVCMSAVAGTKKEWLPVKRIMDGILCLIGLYIIVHATFQIARNFTEFRTIDNLKSFLLPIVFTLIYLPFVYCVALTSEYEMLFLRLSYWLKDDKSLIKAAKKQAIICCLFSLNRLRRLSNKSIFTFMDVKDEADIQKVIHNAIREETAGKE